MHYLLSRIANKVTPAEFPDPTRLVYSTWCAAWGVAVGFSKRLVKIKERFSLHSVSPLRAQTSTLAIQTTASSYVHTRLQPIVAAELCHRFRRKGAMEGDTRMEARGSAAATKHSITAVAKSLGLKAANVFRKDAQRVELVNTLRLPIISNEQALMNQNADI
eukprot:964210-Rhodomonas_salina.1